MEPDSVERRRYIGSSEASAIVGLDPNRTAADIWYEKTGQLEVRRSGPPSVSAELGKFLEPAVIAWVSEKIGRPVQTQIELIHPNGISRATCDGLCLEQDPGVLIEAKTSGLIVRPRFFDDFGEEGSDEVPDHIAVQVHHQLAVCNASSEVLQTRPVQYALVPALLAHRGFVLFRICPDLEVERDIIKAEEDFFQEYVIPRRKPPESLPSMQVLKALKRDPTKVVEINPSIIEQWQEAKGRLKAAKDWEETMHRVVIDDLGDAEVGRCKLGEVAYRESKRAGYTVAETTVRRLTFRKARGAPAQLPDQRR